MNWFVDASRFRTVLYLRQKASAPLVPSAMRTAVQIVSKDTRVRGDAWRGAIGRNGVLGVGGVDINDGSATAALDKSMAYVGLVPVCALPIFSGQRWGDGLSTQTMLFL